MITTISSNKYKPTTDELNRKLIEFNRHGKVSFKKKNLTRKSRTRRIKGKGLFDSVGKKAAETVLDRLNVRSSKQLMNELVDSAIDIPLSRIKNWKNQKVKKATQFLKKIAS